MNPYLVLGVPVDADDQTIRGAWLAAIKVAPPDVDPKRFQAITTAYEQIKNEVSRYQHTLFDHTPPGDSPMDVFVRHAQFQRQPQALTFDMMKQLLRACSKT